MPCWLRFAPLAILAMCLLPSSAAAATAPSTPALPDTGLFAPVAAQFKARNDQLLRSESQPVTPERLRLLLARRETRGGGTWDSGTLARIAAGTAFVFLQELPPAQELAMAALAHGWQPLHKELARLDGMDDVDLGVALGDD